MNRDLMLSILAMDAYNRGYGAGITMPGDGRIGSAKILDLDLPLGSQAAGFSATAYLFGNPPAGVDIGFASGEKVISYRGTDNTAGGPDIGSSDLVHGYSLALGNPYAEQGELAAEFYHDVTGKNAFTPVAGVTLTGHSLGGGLAGLIGATSGTPAVLFDHMPFGIAAVALEALDGPGIVPPGNPKGYFTNGEFLQFVRAGAAQAAFIPEFGETLGALTAAYEATIPKITLNSHASGLDRFSQYHSIALLTDLLYASDPASVPSTDWQFVGTALWSAYFDPAVAGSIAQAAQITNLATGSILGTVTNAIAYSAIDSGTMPFGNTGIKAMFDDANDLGHALHEGGSASALKGYTAFLAKSLVEYAGELALNHVVAGAGSIAAHGMLALSFDGSVISADYTDATWKAASGGTMPSIAGRSELVTALLPASIDMIDVGGAMRQYWHAASSDVFDRVSLAALQAGTTVVMAGGVNVGKASLFVGLGGADSVTGSAGNDLMIGNGGADQLSGGNGNDILFGGDGNDLLTGGRGDNLLVGGRGADSYAVSSLFAGTTTIDDDTGRLKIDGVMVGTAPESTPEGSLASGVAVEDQDHAVWYIGNFALTLAGSDLHLDSAAAHLVLTDYAAGDYGIRLGADTLDQDDIVTDHAFQDLPDYLDIYAIHHGPASVSYIRRYSSQTPPADAQFLGHTDYVRPQDITGTDGNDVVTIRYRANGPTIITTGAGHDIIDTYNDYGTQTIDAGADRDFITTHGGRGHIYAGDGDDLVSMQMSRSAFGTYDSETYVYGGNGRDSFDGVGVKFLDGGPGLDSWAFHPYAQDIYFNAETGIFRFSSNISGPTELYQGTFRNIERFDIASNAENSTVITGGGDDQIAAYGRSNSIQAGAGNDAITSDGYADKVFGGSGDDAITANLYADGASTFLGQDGNDVIDTAGGGYRLYGGNGNDRLISLLDYESAYNKVNALYGGNGDDYLRTDRGIARLEGGKGNDDIRVGIADSSSHPTFDTIIFTKGDGADTIFDVNNDWGSGSSQIYDIRIDGIDLTGNARLVGTGHWQLAKGGEIFDLTEVEDPNYVLTDLVITRTDAPSDSITLLGFFGADFTPAEAFGLTLAAHAMIG